MEVEVILIDKKVKLYGQRDVSMRADESVVHTEVDGREVEGFRFVVDDRGKILHVGLAVKLTSGVDLV